MTRAMPARSCRVGTCPSTISPIPVAVAGRIASISAKVDRGSRAIASWSVTYGVTEEHTPTPMPHSSQLGCTNVGAAPATPNGVATTAAMSIAAPSWSIPLITPASAGAPLLLLLAVPSAAVLAIRCPSTT